MSADLLRNIPQILDPHHGQARLRVEESGLPGP